MTKAAIDVLTKGDKGFFLMVEGGRIDHAAHANDPTGVIWDTLAFDDAVKTACEFYKSHKNETLIVVVGDHDTGGMGLGMDSMGYKLNMAALTAAQILGFNLLGYNLVHTSGLSHIGFQSLKIEILNTSFKGVKTQATNSLNGQIDLENLYHVNDTIIAGITIHADK